MDRQDTPQSQLSRILEQVRALAEQVRMTADRVHLETEEAHRLAAAASDRAERSRELSRSNHDEAHYVIGSIEQTLDDAKRNNPRQRR